MLSYASRFIQRLRFLRPSRVAIPLIGVLALTGCGENLYSKHRDPAFSDMAVNGQTIPEVARISIPMPPDEPRRRIKRAEASGLWNRGTRSFFGDQRARRVGDILTVLIEIDDQAQLKNASERSRSGSQAADTPAFLGYGSQIDKILPGVDEADLPTGGSIIDLGSSSATAGEGTIKRNESISLRIAALIIDELPNGNFVIAGRQEVKVNHELRELRVAGVIRPKDVAASNTVPYDKIAEARISYGGKGQLSQVQQPRYGSNFLDVILPY